MAKRASGGGPAGVSTLLVFVAVVAFVWGLERWRRHAAHRAGHSSRARVTALARCLLGPDGATVMRAPDAARQRLRALAMATPAEAAVTWFDRCVPLSAALARHAAEVDNTHALTAAETRVADTARALHGAMTRVGLVWRIRSGDPETDMDAIAERLARVASEIELANADAAPRGAPDGPVAPAPPALAEGELLAIPGLEPATVGTPTRFYVGSPLPSVTEVVREGSAWSHTTLANEPSVAWHLGAQALTRIDVPLVPSPDGLAPLRYLRPGVEATEAHVTPVTNPLEGLHVALAAVPAGRALWVAQWSPWNGAVLARFVPGRTTAAALTLAQAPLDAVARATDPVAGRSTAFDERIAIAPLGAAGGVVVAYTQHLEGGRARVVLSATSGDTDRAAVAQLAAREVAGRAPELEFCERGPGAPAVLLVAGAREWLALAVAPTGVTELARVTASAGRSFDERLSVRCGAPGGGLVAFAREHPRSSPVLVCDDAAAAATTLRCRAVDPPLAPQLATLPLYTTRTRDARALAHAEWPVLFDAATTHVIAARAVGPVVAVARRARAGNSGGWSAERVVFDAAAHTHGETVEGLGLYAAGADVTLAVATPGGLHLLRSADAGETFH